METTIRPKPSTNLPEILARVRLLGSDLNLPQNSRHLRNYFYFSLFDGFPLSSPLGSHVLFCLDFYLLFLLLILCFIFSFLFLFSSPCSVLPFCFSFCIFCHMHDNFVSCFCFCFLLFSSFSFLFYIFSPCSY